VNLTQRQQMYLVVALLVLVGLGGLYYKFVMPQLQKYAEAAAKVTDLKVQLKNARERYYNHSAPDEVIRELEQAIGPAKQELARLKRVYNTTERKVPEGEEFLGFYFREEFEKVKDELLNEAREKRVFIPEDIGFGGMPNIPDDSIVEVLLNQLSNAKFILELLMNSGVSDINLTVGVPVYRDGFIEILPYKTTFLTTMEDLVKLLRTIVGTGQYLSVRSLALSGEKHLQGTFVRVEMVLFTTRLLDRETTAGQPVMEEEEMDWYDEEEW